MIDATKKYKLFVRIPTADRDRLTAIAKTSEGGNLSAVAREAIDDYLAHHDNQENEHAAPHHTNRPSIIARHDD